MAHELGHVCINVKRFQNIRSQDLEKSRNAFLLTNDLSWPRTEDGLSPRCTPTVQHEQAWETLSSQVGLNTESIKCLERLVQLSPKPRFEMKKKEQECKSVCKNDVWDEALADVVHFDILPTSDWFPHLFPGYCTTYRRDGSHALSADLLSCYLLTPSFKKKIEIGMACRS